LNLYTDRKVYHRLAGKLPNCTPTHSDMVRFSVQGDLAGVAAQRAAHFSTYASDPDIAVISQFPEAAWDPSQPQVGARFGIVWLTLADLHHNATGDTPVAAVVAVGDTIFFNITLSTTQKHIPREDGEDENGVTRLMLGVLNHYPSLRASRFAEDVTRAGRDEVDWAAITGKHKTRAIAMHFGGQRFDPAQAGDWLALSALGMVSGNDDPMRRRKLTGKRLMKYKLGGAAISEMQMPHGWRHKKDHHGRPVTVGERGLIPEADPTMVPVLRALYDAHATGETYETLATRLIAFEEEGLLRRRDQTDLDNTYGNLAEDNPGGYDAVKSVFVRSSYRPRTPPSEEATARYLAGDDPEEIFDADTRLYLAKVELVRTGRYFRRLKSDIRGRNIVLDGISAQYEDDRDEYGWFDVLSEPWAWPVNADGVEVARFGIADATCRQVGARLLRELRKPKEPTGGRAHQTVTRRALQRFENWTVEPGQVGSVYADEATQWGVEARCNNSGKANFIVLFRRASIGHRPRKGWSFFGPGEKKPQHIAATGSLAELAASVAHHLDVGVRALLDPREMATVRAVSVATAQVDELAVHKTKLARLRDEAEQHRKEAQGHRSMAARASIAGNDREADAYADQASEAATRADRLTDEADCLARDLQDRCEDRDRAGREDAGDVSIAAYLVAGLERAARNNGAGGALLGQLCDEHLVDWRFQGNGDDLVWSCNALTPLASGGHAKLPLTGTVSNVRTRTGKSFATTGTVVRYLFEEGRDLTAIAELLDVTRAGLLKRRVMPWLVQHGVTSRGAKCALVDHPVQDVRRRIYSHLTAASASTEPVSAYTRQLCRTYLDPELSWGDAAVPDDTTWVQHALELLTADTETRRHGLPVLDVALALGRAEAEVRELVKPQRRSGGFTRPRYLVYADKSRTKVKAIPCPHARCRGRRHADHVVMLPEVAASGYGVICRHCRRAPAQHDEWPITQFPQVYLASWTNCGPGGSLRIQPQTAAGPDRG
jgi:hypothetical protein